MQEGQFFSAPLPPITPHLRINVRAITPSNLFCAFVSEWPQEDPCGTSGFLLVSLLPCFVLFCFVAILHISFSQAGKVIFGAVCHHNRTYKLTLCLWMKSAKTNRQITNKQTNKNKSHQTQFLPNTANTMSLGTGQILLVFYLSNILQGSLPTLQIQEAGHLERL